MICWDVDWKNRDPAKLFLSSCLEIKCEISYFWVTKRECKGGKPCAAGRGRPGLCKYLFPDQSWLEAAGRHHSNPCPFSPKILCSTACSSALSSAFSQLWLFISQALLPPHSFCSPPQLSESNHFSSSFQSWPCDIFHLLSHLSLTSLASQDFLLFLYSHTPPHPQPSYSKKPQPTGHTFCHQSSVQVLTSAPAPWLLLLHLPITGLPL